ncbi:EamA-like transporter family protein [Ruegeria halocynthiae]|uniref:EamA-like transporter family protein n=1 Tax=Ruegeria halocynthiae TaxID=985054 RepID=A0A1H3G659_9RHOB|nr:EamA family transporter [Ruegeria halocynthiae]SDX98756.1 EamA-like transporter family protein [Ruegeria halocynthiae]
MIDVRKGVLLGLLGVFSFSLTLPMTRIAVQGLSPDQIAIWRAIVAALVAGVVLLILRPERPRGRQFIPLIGCSLGTVFGFPFFISLAMQTVPASQGAIVVGCPSSGILGQMAA